MPSLPTYQIVGTFLQPTIMSVSFTSFILIKAIEKVKPENYKNYFHHAYGINEKIYIKNKPSTRKRKIKNYK